MLTATLALTAVAAIPAAAQARFVLGGDVSFLSEVEAGGGVFFEDGVPVDPVAVFRTHGFSMARLRLWHDPVDGVSGLAATRAMARWLHDAGFDLLLDLHYSDTWADPGQQTKPAAWTGLPFAVLRDSVYAYTRRVVEVFRDQGTPPAMVQLGNEIIGGFLWEDGRVGGAFDTPAQWANLAALLDAAATGVREVVPEARLMIHLDRGGDAEGARWFFDHLLAEGVSFDVIGLSFYPWWHGTLDDLDTTLRTLAEAYGKDLLVVETAYPWTLAWADDVHNLVGEARQLHPGYDATPEGQRAFLSDLIALVRAVPDDHGLGVVYWAPDYISAPGLGSVWENLALFDFDGHALPALDAFAEAVLAATVPATGLPALSVHATPNPAADATVFHLTLPAPGAVHLAVYDGLGRRVAVVLDGFRPAGPSRVRFDASGLPAGVYLARLSTPTALHTARLVVVR